MSSKDFSETIYSLCRKRGYIWGPSPEIYGGSAGLYDLGPLGKLLKNRLESVIRDSFVRAGFWEVECPTISPAAVWKASGHLDGFTDPVTQCKSCGLAYRADNLIEELVPDAHVRGQSLDALTDFIRQHNLRCPSCKGELSPVAKYSLMLQTRLGLNQEAYMRPETATTTYLLFKRLLTFFRDKLPAAVFQIGKAYRNEISPRQGLLRLREFTQVEGQLFLLDSDKQNWPQFKNIQDESLPLLPYPLQEAGGNDAVLIRMSDALEQGHFQSPAYAWCVYLAYSIFLQMGFSRDVIRLRQHLPTERAHYAADAWDIEISTKSFGWVECCGVHDRGSYDLQRHQEFSKQSLSVKVDGREVVPTVLEIAFGVERPMFCQIDNVYAEDSERSWLRFAPHIAPIQVAVFPLMGKNELVGPATKIYNEMMECGLIAYYDESGSIGRRYRRQDEIGTPFCITVDYQTLEDDSVTVRERDSMRQVRVKIIDLASTIRQLVNGKACFTSLESDHR